MGPSERGGFQRFPERGRGGFKTSVIRPLERTKSVSGNLDTVFKEKVCVV